MSTRQMQEVRGLAERSADSLRRLVGGSETLRRTRTSVVAGWRAIAQEFEEAGDYRLADRVYQFVEQMPPLMTDQLQSARQFGGRGRSQGVDPMERTL